jgi:hypothetical protein
LPSEDRAEALAQLEIIETNGIALGTILENIIDTLDIGRLTNKLESKMVNTDSVNTTLAGEGAVAPSLEAKTTPTPTAAFDVVLENVVMNAISLEDRSRRATGGSSMENVEVVLEVLPRSRGTWMMAQDPGPLTR